MRPGDEVLIDLQTTALTREQDKLMWQRIERVST